MNRVSAIIAFALAATSFATSFMACSDVCSTLASTCDLIAPFGTDAADRCTNLVNNCNLFCEEHPLDVPNFLDAISDLVPSHLQARQVPPSCDRDQCAGICSSVTAECFIRFGKDSTYCHEQNGRCKEYCTTHHCVQPKVVNGGVTVVIPATPVAFPVASNKIHELATEKKPRCCIELCQTGRDCAFHPRPPECAAEKAKCLASCHDIGRSRSDATPKVLSPAPVAVPLASNKTLEAATEQNLTCCQELCQQAHGLRAPPTPSRMWR